MAKRKIKAAKKEKEKEINTKLKDIVEKFTLKELIQIVFPMFLDIEVEKKIKKIRIISLRSYNYKVSKKKCLLCKNKAQATHHINYNPELTISLCKKHHFKHGQKKISWWLLKIKENINDKR